MQIIRYASRAGKTEYGYRQDGSVILKMEGDPFGQYSLSAQPADVEKILAPVVPSSIYCIGANYRHHCRECNVPIPEYPVVFMKGLNAVQNPGDPILIPSVCDRQEMDYEAELAVVIGKSCKNVARSEALNYVLGYTCANDVSARRWQLKMGGSQWCRGKGFDTFLPLGPHLVTPEELPDPNTLKIRTAVNGEVRQDWTTADMIFDVPTLIEFLSQGTTLLPGTVILTGTPHGVGMSMNPPRWLAAGDRVTVEIEKIGTLTNPVEDE